MKYLSLLFLCFSLTSCFWGRGDDDYNSQSYSKIDSFPKFQNEYIPLDVLKPAANLLKVATITNTFYSSSDYYQRRNANQTNLPPTNQTDKDPSKNNSFKTIGTFYYNSENLLIKTVFDSYDWNLDNFIKTYSGVMEYKYDNQKKIIENILFHGDTNNGTYSKRLYTYNSENKISRIDFHEFEENVEIVSKYNYDLYTYNENTSVVESYNKDSILQYTRTTLFDNYKNIIKDYANSGFHYSKNIYNPIYFAVPDTFNCLFESYHYNLISDKYYKSLNIKLNKDYFPEIIEDGNYHNGTRKIYTYK